MSDIRQVIKNLLTPPDPIRKYCSVVRQQADGIYVVKDEAGNFLQVGSDAVWKDREQVVVEAGRIVRSGGQLKVNKRIEV